MSLKHLVKRMILSFFVIFSGTVISMFLVLLILSAVNEGALFMVAVSDLGYMLSISILTNLTQLFLYSKKDISRKQLLFRYFIIALLVVTIVLVIAIYFAEWIDVYEQPIWLVVVLGLLIVFVVIAVLIIASKQTNLENYANTDYLTKVYNRRYFMDIAAKTLASCIKNNRKFSLIMIDIDHFKKINDNHGHAIGDEVLKVFAARVKHVVKSGSIIARFGGEEFVVVVTDETREKTKDIASWIQKNLNERPFMIRDIEISVTASFGIASSDGSENLSEIVNNSDKALYNAKAAGRNTIAHYDIENEID